MKKLVRKVPILYNVAVKSYMAYVKLFKVFPGSKNYWEQRYEKGGNSGSGSYGKFAEFKAEVLNQFVDNNQVKSVIEFGCGDGNQLMLSKYPSYIGFDVSKEAIARCNQRFSKDATKTFKVMELYHNEFAELSLSLDVIYHLLEDDVYDVYMHNLFSSALRYVIIYSSNTDKQSGVHGTHVKHRTFSNWIERNKPEWKLAQFIPNRYPYDDLRCVGSFADFYVYEKQSM